VVRPRLLLVARLGLTTGSTFRRAVLFGAWAITVGLGLAFIFVKAPHPWGWEGFDNYRQYALALARGELYPTLEVPWGYPAFLAVFYRVFGDRQWIPLVVQALLNGFVPLLTYSAVRARVGEREALLAAVLVACFSFNTVYASTQTSDSLCTVLFVAAVVLFMRAQSSRHLPTFVLAGVAAGAAMQIRPNLLLLPIWLAALAWALTRPRPALGQLAVFAATAFLVLAPWTIRNARLTGRFMPASAHGGIQLWYGSLQVGPFFTHWFDNPRDVFGERVFPSARPDGRPLVASSLKPIGGNCDGVVPQTVGVTYWTDRDHERVSLPMRPWQEGGVHFEIPPQPNDTAIYYYYDATWTSPSGSIAQQSPVAGPFDPNVFFVTSDDFGDQDRHDDFVDVFDVVRLARYEAWREAVAQSSTLDFDHDGSLTFQDLDLAVGILESDKNNPIAVPSPGTARRVKATEANATVEFRDGSTLVVPRAFSGRVLDLDARGEIARGVLHTRRSSRSVGLSREQVPGLRSFQPCFNIAGGIDSVFYRAQPQSQDRYARLALDDIRRTPIAYAVAMARRMIGIFVTVGSESRDAAHQFAGSRALYFAGAVLSMTVFALFVSGLVVAAFRCGRAIVPLAAAVLYVPVTISPFLTNARYSLSGQPFVFAFVAIAIVAAYDRLSDH
jgi:Dolichyl-phosphate-mannose-protein mannosyltransferase